MIIYIINYNVKNNNKWEHIFMKVVQNELELLVLPYIPFE